METKELPFAYSTSELGKIFLEESFMSDLSLLEQSKAQIRINLKAVLKEKLRGRSGSYTEEDRTEITEVMREGKLAFGYMALMLQDEHPLLKGWAENDKRLALHKILGRKIMNLQTDIAEHELGFWRDGNVHAREEIEREMMPYKNFQKNLLERATPTPRQIKK